MIDIVFKRNRGREYKALGEEKRYLFESFVGEYYSKKEVEEIQKFIKNIKENYSDYFELYKVFDFGVKIMSVEKFRFEEWFNFEMDDEIVEFKIDAEPYKVGDIVYVKQTNTYYYVMRISRDSDGKWIYDVTLSNHHNQEEKYTQKEENDFKELILKKNKEIEDYYNSDKHNRYNRLCEIYKAEKNKINNPIKVKEEYINQNIEEEYEDEKTAIQKFLRMFNR